MFMIIPAIFGGILLVLGVLDRWILRDWANDRPIGWVIALAATGAFTLLALISCPINYLGTRDEAWQAEQYYESLILPNVIEEGVDYVVVDNITAGVWQSGEFNIYGYNSYVRVTRHWQEVPIISSVIYPVPEQLKYVRIK